MADKLILEIDDATRKLLDQHMDIAKGTIATVPGIMSDTMDYNIKVRKITTMHELDNIVSGCKLTVDDLKNAVPVGQTKVITMCNIMDKDYKPLQLFRVLSPDNPKDIFYYGIQPDLIYNKIKDYKKSPAKKSMLRKFFDLFKRTKQEQPKQKLTVWE